MIVVAGRAGSVDGLRLIRLVVEEVEVGSLLVQRSVGNDNTNHRASEFAKLAFGYLTTLGLKARRICLSCALRPSTNIFSSWLT